MSVKGYDTSLENALTDERTPQSFRRTWKKEPERTFEAFAFPAEKATPRKRSGSQREREKSGKRVRVENEGSSFHLDAPDNAAMKSLVSARHSQCSGPNRRDVQKSDYRHRLQYLDFAARHVET
jgi:hypothetical protein